MIKLVFLLSLLLPCLAFAQAGEVTIVQDSGVQKAVDLYGQFAKDKRSVSGFRIQIVADQHRQTVMDQKLRFEQLYPGVNTYFNYQPPQFKLRVGNFISREEANSFLQQVKDDFPMAFLVPDKVIVKGVGW
ncbi:MAG: SPOR domain-containing protein [Chitinophagales bacterium]|nr:SPOR domain-containing protein [Chitinophagales bacterium]